ncbi:hypothetical protein JCM16358_10280 [Halanaerocella petrolearia]
MSNLEDYSKIYIDPEESLNALLEKIKTDPKDKLVIIIHDSSAIFSGQINIKLIKNYADRVEKELIFITNIDKTRNLLINSGFDVYSDLSVFENNQLPTVESAASQEGQIIAVADKDSEQRKSIMKRLTLLLTLFLVAGGVWFYFALPFITVEITPILKDKIVVNQITGVTKATNIDIQNKTIPLINKAVEVEKKTKVQATGSKKMGVARATGVLTLINNQRKDIKIPRGTVVSTRNGVQFRTLKQVTVPEAQVNKFMDMVVGMKAGKAEVNIEAIHKGVVGNISRARIVKFAKESYPVKIVNPEPTEGGKDRLVSVITRNDIERALKKAKADLSVKGRKRLIDKFGSNLIYFKDNIEFSKPVLKPNREVGDLAQELSVVGRIKAKSFAVKKEGLKDLVFKLYKRELGSKYKLKSSQIAIKEIEVEDINPKKVRFKIKTKGQVTGSIDKEKIIKQLRGKKAVVAKKLLKKEEEIADYQIEPDNQVNLPEFKFGIDLVIKEPLRE